MKSRKLCGAAVIAAAVLTVVTAAFIACEAPFPEHIRPNIALLSLTVQSVDFDGTGRPVNRPNVERWEPEPVKKTKKDKDGKEIVIDPESRIPDPIFEEEWDDSAYSPAGADLREMWFLLETHTETARIIAEATPGTEVAWGIGSTGARPEKFFQPGAALEFGNDDVIYVRVSTRNGLYRSYYRIHARLASKTNLLSLLSVAGRDAKINPPADGRNNWDGDPDNPAAQTARDNAPELKVSITTKEAHDTTRPAKLQGAGIRATKLNANATIRYAVIKPGIDPKTVNYSELDFVEGEKPDTPVYIPDADDNLIPYPAANIIFEDQDLLVVEVTAQNTFDKYYYKFRVSVGHIVNILSLNMKTVTGITPAEDIDVKALGVPNKTWGDTVAGTFATAAVTPNFKVTITLEDEHGDFELITLDNVDEPLPGAFENGDNYSRVFKNKEILAIKVTSATKDASNEPVEYIYYKVRVDLQSAIILQQPKGAVYFINKHTYQRTPVTIKIAGEDKTQQRILIDANGTRELDRTIEPLEAKLDRGPGTGMLSDMQFTYQWYTANSWYGGYGFDQDGRIVGDPGCQVGIHPYHPMTERGGLDEKNNVSFHNGGNQFYRLPVAAYRDSSPRSKPGDTDDGFEGTWLDDYEQYKIPNATGRTYTPVIGAGNRPFISGYSNQTQYYWVIVTDPSGREVISERAAIVTEWGEKFHLGEPTGEKVNKEHYIVNLYAYLEGNTGNDKFGLQVKPMNVEPYKKISGQAARSTNISRYEITFPANFDIMKYSVVTCQARFYFGDGTLWIQNWTQGDMGFERNGEGQVLFYNLTSDNATKGLGSDSKEPMGAGLTDTPTHVVIRPDCASDEPVKEKKAEYLADGKTPKNLDNAQGYFTPYIEIVELRFEGPARPR